MDLLLGWTNSRCSHPSSHSFSSPFEVLQVKKPMSWRMKVVSWRWGNVDSIALTTDWLLFMYIVCVCVLSCRFVFAGIGEEDRPQSTCSEPLRRKGSTTNLPALCCVLATQHEGAIRKHPLEGVPAQTKPPRAHIGSRGWNDGSLTFALCKIHDILW